MSIELPKLTLQQKWETAEKNLIYFIVCGITYAKSRGQTAEDFGTWAGQIAAPYWEEEKSLGIHGLVEGICYNKQQFHDFEMEILEESDTAISAKMRGFGENLIRNRLMNEVSAEEYIRFFDKKWVAIADFMGLEYKQHTEGDWVVFSVSKK